MANIDVSSASGEAPSLLAASLVGSTSYTVPPARYLALSSTTGNAGTLGTEVTAGNGRQSITFGTVSVTGSGATAAASTTTTTAQSFTNMPATTTTGVEIYTAATGTTRRLWYGALASAKTTASGDTLSFAVGAITATLS